MEVARAFLEGRDVEFDPVTQAVRMRPPAAADDGQAPAEPWVDRCPRDALEAAHRATILPGSSTACVLRLHRPAKTLRAANLVQHTPPRGAPFLAGKCRFLRGAGAEVGLVVGRGRCVGAPTRVGTDPCASHHLFWLSILDPRPC
jgi:hypothetical protein